MESQGRSILFPMVEARGSVMKIFVTAVAGGFPMALILTWVLN
jgi:hypothetical protein